jgi:hypothetical protein
MLVIGELRLAIVFMSTETTLQGNSAGWLAGINVRNIYFMHETKASQKSIAKANIAPESALE